MTSRRWVPAIVTCLLIAACGGSAHPATTSSTSTGSSSSTTESSTQTTSAANGGAPITTTSTTPRPPEVPKGKGHKSASSPSGGVGESAGVHVSSTLQVQAGGELSPASVSVPAGAAIQLTLTNHGGVSHQVELLTPKPQKLALAAEAHLTATIPALRSGTFRILVDGKPRGRLLIGAQGGP